MIYSRCHNYSLAELSWSMSIGLSALAAFKQDAMGTQGRYYLFSVISTVINHCKEYSVNL